MYCRKCGEQLPNDAKFCRKCGTMVEAKQGLTQGTVLCAGQETSGLEDHPEGNSHREPSPVRAAPVRTTKIIAAVAVAAVILIAALAGAVYGITPAQRARRQVALGDRYLEEMDYERAIAAYERAVSIDPTYTAAYEGWHTSVESYATTVSPEGTTEAREQARKVADEYEKLEKALRSGRDRDIDTGIPEKEQEDISRKREAYDRYADGGDPEWENGDSDGAGADGEGGEPGTDGSDGSDGADGEDAAQKIDYTPYQEILDKYQEGSRKYAGDSNAALTAYMENADPMLNAFAFYAASYDMSLVYALYDIDGNGIRELLIGGLSRGVEPEDPDLSATLFAISTLDRSGTVYPVSRDTTERMVMTIYEDGTIYIYGSSGAGSGEAEFYRFEEEGEEAGLAIYLADEVEVDYERDPINAYFHGDERMNDEEFRARFTDRPEIKATWKYLETPVTEYVETVFGTEEGLEAGGDVDEAVWKKAYREHLEADRDLSDQLSRCGMFYADGDRVPELVIYYGYEYMGTAVLSYQNGRVETYIFDRYGGTPLFSPGERTSARKKNTGIRCGHCFRPTKTRR